VLSRRWRDALDPVVLGRATSSAGASCASTQPQALRTIAIPVVQQRSL